MNKAIKIAVLSVAATLIVLFITILLLALPIGERGSVIPLLALYVTGGITAAIFLFGGILSLFCRFRRLTRGVDKYYDNANTSDSDVKKGE